MNVYLITLYFFMTLAALTAAGVLLSRNVLYASLSLVVCLLSIAALYVLAFAEFVAVTQILVYAGGILVVIIFGIMLTAKFGQLPLRVTHKNVFSGFLLSAPLLALMVYLLGDLPRSAGPLSPVDQNPQTLETLGVFFLTDYVLVFEISGLLLLLALIGAAVLASHQSSPVSK